ncbi:response regulator transcription factor [Cryobacterium sp. SO2]|uniref:response regulator transcription factor n=1 Tax=Cryobacterium sp. SO2 TaxID=1897060 RepID=UPI00223E3ABF|nr:response regulator transcription factor [Cryobacterium sp. SO2]WEO76576.1 response regulator transcription factor [Cryobacterium sp. SO2]
MIRVMIVDDQEMIRAGLRTMIDAHPELSVVAEVGDGLAAIGLLDPDAVDVVLLDIRMPGIDGVETTRRIRAVYPSSVVRILILTTFEQDEYVLTALRAGADGFLGKGASRTELTEGILAVAGGDHALSSAAVNALVEHVSLPVAMPSDPAAVARFVELTQREREVVTLIVEGLDNADIAARIFVSPFTVKTHANRAMMKSGTQNRAQLVSLAVQAGIHS